MDSLKAILLFVTFVFLTLLLQGQEERKHIRKGNKCYEEGYYDLAEKEYQKAFDIENSSHEAIFNKGTIALKKEDYEAAVSQFESAANMAEDKMVKSKAYYNMGNAYLGQKKYKEALGAYKNALKQNPDDMDAKYNLAYSQSMIKAQPPQENQEQQKEDNKDGENEEEKNKPNEQEGEDNKKEGENQKESNNDEEASDGKSDQKSKPDEKGEEESEQDTQPQISNISKEEAERMLDALEDEEKKVKEKIMLQEQKSKKTKQDKDW